MSVAGTSSLLEYVLLNALKTEAGNTFDFIRDSNGLSLNVKPTDPNIPMLIVDHLGISDQGLTGNLRLDIQKDNSITTDALIPGFPITLTAFDISLQNGNFSNTHIAGQLRIPYFEIVIDVELGIEQGGYSLSLAAQQSDPTRMTADGRVKLDLPLLGDSKIEFILDSLAIAKFDQDYKLKLGGVLTIDVAGLSLPSTGFKGLWIDSDGHVELEGGWLNLPDHTAIDFYGFHLELKRLGMGRDSSGRFIGFHGEVHLVEGLSLGGSVRGLVINLDSGEVALEGVAVDFIIPGALSFSGEINFLKAENPDDAKQKGLPESFVTLPGLKYPIHLFFGGMRVDILAVPGLSLDARLIVGEFGDTFAFFLAFDAELPPPGIVLFPGISLYGIQGLFASSFRPDPSRDGDTFWEWYKFPEGPTGKIDKTAPPDYTASEPRKWLPYFSPGAIAFGAGGTIGTSDDGFAASATVALVMIFPGPVISLIGRAKILSTRSQDPKDYSALDLEAMATYDARATEFDLNIETRYDILKLIDIEGNAAVHASTLNGWYFALGLPPRNKRIRARILDIFESNSYFVISQNGIVFGSYAGYDKSADFGPFSLSFNVYTAIIGAVQWSPLQFGSGIEMHGEVHVSAFGIGFGLTVDALLEGSAPHPFWIHGELHVDLETPWPLPDIHATIGLTWGSNDEVPPLPREASRVEATLIDHYGRSDTVNLVGKVSNADGFPEAIPTDLAKIPQDAHFTLRFPRPTVFLGQVSTVETQTSLPPEIATLPQDDLSNLNLNPKFQWVYQRTLTKVELFQQSGGSWKPIPIQSAEIDATTLRVLSSNGVVEDTLSLTTGILPQTPGLYALKVVTQIQPRRVDQEDFENGEPLIEFFYFQMSDPLLDLSSYTQWFYPDHGAVNAYFGYDVSVEFNETYVNQLYRSLGHGDVGEALHFRCVDRNQRHVVFDAIALHLPAILPFSALVAETLKIPIRPDQAAFEPLQRIWPRALQPQTRYTLDVVPAPSSFDGFCLLQASPEEAREDLEEYYRDEAKLPVLVRSEFTTSRYATFRDHLSAAANQTSVRKYLTVGDLAPVLANRLAHYQDLKNVYVAKQGELRAIAQQISAVAPSNPIALIDLDLETNLGLKTRLRNKRTEVDNQWNQFSTAVFQLFDESVRALGRPDLASDQHSPLPPDTELSSFVLADGNVPVLLLESPEPIPWQRVFGSARLVPETPLIVFWNLDGTRSLLMAQGHMFQPNDQLELTFQGNLGAEAPCITKCGEAVTEIISLIYSGQ